MYDVARFGQVFTPPAIVEQMLQLRRNHHGRTLEPSAGDGAFAQQIPDCVSIELDTRLAKPNTLNIDFFDYPLTEQFDTIIGNPPYVRYQDILPSTKAKLRSTLFDERSNLYLFFIEKCIRHLHPNGELIFITPRDFLKATSSIKLNQFIFEQGTITDLIDLGDKRVFQGFTPNCIIFRFEKGNMSRKTNGTQTFACANGQLLFTDVPYMVRFSDVFTVRVGAVSGLDRIFSHEEFGNEEFVCSTTHRTGKTKKMIFNIAHQYLEQFKTELLGRKIKHFDYSNWWQWGRLHHITPQERIYVNCKTRNPRPFFLHDCKNYDGSVLAIFPRDQTAKLSSLCDLLNEVHWQELGFVCDGRYLFSQRSLENTLLPPAFADYVASPQSL